MGRISIIPNRRLTYLRVHIQAVFLTSFPTIFLPAVHGVRICASPQKTVNHSIDFKVSRGLDLPRQRILPSKLGCNRAIFDWMATVSSRLNNGTLGKTQHTGTRCPIQWFAIPEVNGKEDL